MQLFRVDKSNQGALSRFMSTGHGINVAVITLAFFPFLDKAVPYMQHNLLD